MKRVFHMIAVVLLVPYIAVAFAAQMTAFVVPATSFSTHQMRALDTIPPTPPGHRFELKRHIPAMKVVIDLSVTETKHVFLALSPAFSRLAFHPESHLLTERTVSTPKRGPPVR